jgi:hypothetical protein
MAIHNEQVATISGGFSKEIEQGAHNLIFDLVQKNQYQYPQKSMIREVVSNGLDSIREKQVAISILKGQSKVEDHYIQLEGEVYKDSGFDPNYYDLKFLSDDNHVEVIYCDGGDLGKDTVIIKDHGVGLGGNRLAGYFNLGFSTKRLNKFALGKFGLGAKSPLATGAAFFTVTSRHNGLEFVFNVYDHKVESLVPQFDLEKLIENPTYEFRNGYKCYCRRTTEKNGLTIEVQVKKHHKQLYIDAVTSQLLYFPNVKCFVKSHSGNISEVNVKADILYEDDLVVMASNSPYSKPHLVLNGVNYGYIDFRELELEEKLGNIGIKVAPEKVSINPSRESLIWDDTTRDVVVQRFKEVVSIAENTVNEKLKETDFMKWVRLCANIGTRGLWDSSNDNTILGRLSKVVDMSKVELTYPLDKDLKYTHFLFEPLEAHNVTIRHWREGSKTLKKVVYGDSVVSSIQDGLPIYFLKGGFSNRKNKYLMTLHPQGFVGIKVPLYKEDGSLVRVEECEESTALKKYLGDNPRKERKEAAARRMAKLHNAIQASKDLVWYEDVVVPEDFKATEKEEDEEEIVEDVETEEAKVSAAERRKLTGATVLHTLRLRPELRNGDTRLFETQKIEAPVHLIDSWSNDEVFYSSNDQEPLLHLAGMMTRPDEAVVRPNLTRVYPESWTDFYAREKPLKDAQKAWETKGYSGPLHYFDHDRLQWFRDDSPIRLIKVAQDNVKYYRDFKHINKFFKEIKSKTITMSNALVRWNTARIIAEKLPQLKFLNNFKQLSVEKALKYERLKGYVDKYWRPISVNKDVMGADDGTTKAVISHLDKVTQFQLFVRQNPTDTESIAGLAQQLFNPQPGVEIENGCAIDTEVYDLYTELLEWSEPVHTLMNLVSPLVGGGYLTNEQEMEIRHYFKYRDCPL